MPIYSSIGIIGSVGKNGKNDPADVRAVQQRLNDLMNPPRVRLAVDGKCGRLTRGMIRDFQRSVLEFRWPDSRVDPAGKTIVALNDPASEGKWARMTIPPDEPDTPHTPGGGGGTKDPVEEIMEELKAEFSMTPSEEATMRKIVKESLKGVRPGGPTTAEKVGANSRLAFTALRNVLVFSSANSGAWVLAQYLGFAAPFVMFYGFLKVLGKSMQSGSRVYGAVGAAYATAYWVHGGMKPFGCRTLIERNKSKPEEWRQNPETMEKCWREGWKAAWEGMEKSCREAAGRAGVPVDRMREALKMALGTVPAVEIARTALKQIAKELRYTDPNVSDTVRLLSDELRYPN